LYRASDRPLPDLNEPRAVLLSCSAVRWFVLLAVGLAAPSALADEPEPTPPPQDPDTEVARRHFDRGTELYDRQEYQNAVAEFKAANEAKPHPDFDYNIARCYDRLGDWNGALTYYRRFLQQIGSGPESQEPRRRVTELEERIRREQPPPVAPPRLRIPAIVVGAGALAAVVIGGGLYGSAAADFPARRDYCASLPRPCQPFDWSDLSARANAAYALWAIGGALAVADVVLWVIEAKRARSGHAQLGIVHF
jgi:tetratricopeptide (TPR) repeat protein